MFERWILLTLTMIYALCFITLLYHIYLSQLHVMKWNFPFSMIYMFYACLSCFVHCFVLIHTFAYISPNVGSGTQVSRSCAYRFLWDISELRWVPTVRGWNLLIHFILCIFYFEHDVWARINFIFLYKMDMMRQMYRIN